MNDNLFLIWAVFTCSAWVIPLRGCSLALRIAGRIAPLLHIALKFLPPDIVFDEISQMPAFISIMAMHFMEAAKLPRLDGIFWLPFVRRAFVD